MGYIILDLEFNNLSEITKYDEEFYCKYPQFVNMECPNEIIEIGAVRLDKYLRELDSFKIYVKPEIFPILNPKIIEITGIKEEDLNRGVPFIEALENLGDFVKDDDIICSWAKDDIAEIIRNSHYYNINHVSWIKKYIDIQEYCTNVMGEKKSLSLKRALQKLSIRKDEGRLHDALNDAMYTADVFRRIYNYRIVKNYIVEDILNMPALTLNSFDDVCVDENNIELKCPKCSSVLEIQCPPKFFNWRFVALSNCTKCNCKVLHEVVIKQTLGGDKVYKNNGMVITEEEYMNYSYKLEKIS